LHLISDRTFSHSPPRN